MVSPQWLSMTGMFHTLKGNDASAVVYFTESGSSITVRESYEDIIAKFHAL